METFLVNVGILFVAIGFVILVYLFPITNALLIAMIYLYAHGVGGYFFMRSPASSSLMTVSVICAFFLLVIAVSADTSTLKKRIEAW
jgi:hypothetical protein